MKLTKDTLIEGQIIKKGTLIQLKEGSKFLVNSYKAKTKDEKEGIKEYYEYDLGYAYIGVRFEKRRYKVGDELSHSKSNIDRLDLRDFPEFGDADYENLPMLGVQVVMILIIGKNI